MPLSPPEVTARARNVRLLLFDVDGVLTDGTVSIHSDGSESKAFFIRDGAAIVWAARQGLEVGLLSGRPSEATSRRAAELGIRLVSQRGPDKRQGYADILAGVGYKDADIAYMGDDLLDLGVLQRVGLSAAPADAVDEVRAQVHWVSPSGGGRGAARELVEVVLRAQDKWSGLLADFLV